jgi:hypothetical protein
MQTGDWQRRTGRSAGWIRRYGPPELAGAAAALLVAGALGGRGAAVAPAAAWAEAAAFYAVVLVREAHARGATSQTLGRLLVELGPAEALDSLLVRPLVMLAAVRVLGLLPGIAAGKLVADVLFYGIAIGSRATLLRGRG